MQKVEVGLIVRSISGHDKNEIFVVIKEENHKAYLINGLSRHLDNPKKKNVKHIIKIGFADDFIRLKDNDKLNNSHIVKILKNFR